MKHHSLFSAAAALAGCCLTMCLAQTPAPATFTGCAMPLEGHPDFLTLCEPQNCSLLRGAVDVKWAGHTVTLRGVLHPATSTQPRTLEVEKAIRVGEACTAVCRPTIPGRGLGPKDKPVGEGGTPGVVAQPPH